VPTCEKRVEGQIMSYPCTLDALHVNVGPEDDREPCMTEEVPSSIRKHTLWDVRQQARISGVAETAEQIADQADQDLAASEIAEPNHTLTASNCMMRPMDSALAKPGDVCTVCAQSQRPAVLVANDEALRAGEMHNPYDANCVKWIEGEVTLSSERCYICQPNPEAEPRPSFVTGETERIDVEQPKQGIQRVLIQKPLIDAEGFPADVEAVHYAMQRYEGADGRVVLNHMFMGDPEVDTVCRHQFCAEPQAMHETSADLGFKGQTSGFTPEEVEQISQIQEEPTKQREGDQVLPKRGDRVVQDWIIETMEESKRVGTERYGQPLMTFDGRLNIQDLAEELRDAFVYISKMQITAEADRETLVRMVAQAVAAAQQEWMADGTPSQIAEVAVDKILDWVLIQRIGPDQVMPVR
jgi:hypothetical protein